MSVAVDPQTFHGSKEVQPTKRPPGQVKMTGDLDDVSYKIKTNRTERQKQGRGNRLKTCWDITVHNTETDAVTF